jgi:hypothetical protein
MWTVEKELKFRELVQGRLQVELSRDLNTAKSLGYQKEDDFWIAKLLKAIPDAAKDILFTEFVNLTVIQFNRNQIVLEENLAGIAEQKQILTDLIKGKE